ncbi:MAG: hypothetical protein HFI34_10585 [Lachnospiraceae bacterium]|nr:hypothetical protein [Lachnospiraceae bacterium]
MACVLLVRKEKIEDPKQWFSAVFEMEDEWKEDVYLEGFKNDSIYFSESENGNFYRFEDMEESYFVYLETKAWLDIAGEHEIIYGFYSDDNLSAEFIHIKDSKCIREYREYYDDEDGNVDKGTLPEFDSWVDVAGYVDESMN